MNFAPGSTLLFCLLSASLSAALQGDANLNSMNPQDAPCPAVTTAPDFDLAGFVSKRWYVHQQAPTQYVPIEKNFCVYAEYEILKKKTLPWRYGVGVHNYAENAKGDQFGGALCAAAADPDDSAKLKVAPCFLPQAVAGPYWVLAYDEGKGYALVSGGQPTFRTPKGCTTGDGVNDSGLWIFLRSRKRDDKLIKEVQKIAKNMDIDVSVMNDVDQTNCEKGGLTGKPNAVGETVAS